MCFDPPVMSSPGGSSPRTLSHLEGASMRPKRPADPNVQSFPANPSVSVPILPSKSICREPAKDPYGSLEHFNALVQSQRSNQNHGLWHANKLSNSHVTAIHPIILELLRRKGYQGILTKKHCDRFFALIFDDWQIEKRVPIPSVEEPDVVDHGTYVGNGSCEQAAFLVPVAEPKMLSLVSKTFYQEGDPCSRVWAWDSRMGDEDDGLSAAGFTRAIIYADQSRLEIVDTWNTQLGVYKARCLLVNLLGSSVARARLEEETRSNLARPSGAQTAAKIDTMSQFKQASVCMQYLDYPGRVCSVIMKLKEVHDALLKWEELTTILSNDIEF